jgi:hypothetical protein
MVRGRNAAAIVPYFLSDGKAGGKVPSFIL